MTDLNNIQLGDTLVLKSLDSEETCQDVVTSIKNPDNKDAFFQIRTKQFDYDFQNFFEIIKIVDAK